MGRKNELTLVFKDQLEFHVAPGFGSDSDVMEVSIRYESYGDSTNNLFNNLDIRDMKKLRRILDQIINFVEEFEPPIVRND
jgi:hypothetical protein